MKIADVFFSIQGEGRLMGVPSAFVRTTGCPLRCVWCDSEYTSWHPEGTPLTLDEILARLADFPTRYVVVTGGEPFIAPGIEDLCAALRERGYHITIETAAVVFKEAACDLASLSPKLTNSIPYQREGGRWAMRHDHQRLRLDVIQRFMERSDYQLKFVIDRAADVEEVRAIVDQLRGVEPAKVLLMPQGTDHEDLVRRGVWLAEVCKQHGFRYCPRLHIELYGNRRGM
ncbi:MAG TPA: 7-carboxy-7-deazaguanine synthase QueE [Gemmataceae bacterium]|nr:7-carboxy-7-deazaguanine synthase QueE [Gemmataceae bacterium]